MNEELDKDVTLLVDLGNGIMADMTEKEYDDYLKRKENMVAQKESIVGVQVGDMIIPMSGTEAEKWHEHLKELEAKKKS